MATRTAHKRENPTPYIEAVPSESNILEWHYLITGPPDTPYTGGQYHGTLIFPSDYPFKPPAIRMTTPSGRFKTNTRLCLSISDYHPNTWNPAWSVSTILTGLLSFMVSDESTAGSIMASEEDRKKYARQSRNWNLINDPLFRLNFPDEARKCQQSRLQELNKAYEEKKVSQQGSSVSISDKGTGQATTSSSNDETLLAQTRVKQGFSMSRGVVIVCLAVVGYAVVTKLLRV